MDEERRRLLAEIARLSGDINRQNHASAVPSRGRSGRGRGRFGRGRGRNYRPYQNRQLVARQPPLQSDCVEYNRVGKCSRRACPLRHDPAHVALCRSFLFHSCPHAESLPDLLSRSHSSNDSAIIEPSDLITTSAPNSVSAVSNSMGEAKIRCRLSHTLTPWKLPLCSKFNSRTGCSKMSTLFSSSDQNAQWTNWTREYAENYCPFIHLTRPKSDGICPLFALGQYCPRGPFECGKRHVYECIYWDDGRKVCQKTELGKTCHLYHPIRRDATASSAAHGADITSALDDADKTADHVPLEHDAETS